MHPDRATLEQELASSDRGPIKRMKARGRAKRDILEGSMSTDLARTGRTTYRLARFLQGELL